MGYEVVKAVDSSMLLHSIRGEEAEEDDEGGENECDD